MMTRTRTSRRGPGRILLPGGALRPGNGPDPYLVRADGHQARRRIAPPVHTRRRDASLAHRRGCTFIPGASRRDSMFPSHGPTRSPGVVHGGMFRWKPGIRRRGLMDGRGKVLLIDVVLPEERDGCHRDGRGDRDSRARRPGRVAGSLPGCPAAKH
jgi:hypothetical protein